MTQRAQVIARDVDAAANRIGIFQVEREEIQHRTLVGDRMAFGELLDLAEDRQQRLPWRAVTWRRFDQQMIVDIDQPRAPFGALQVARRPEQIVRDSTQHPYAPNTQVSLLPPPCEELTTSEPSRSATRVSPPGQHARLRAQQHERPQVNMARLQMRHSGGIGDHRGMHREADDRLRDEIVRVGQHALARLLELLLSSHAVRSRRRIRPIRRPA